MGLGLYDFKKRLNNTADLVDRADEFRLFRVYK